MKNIANGTTEHEKKGKKRPLVEQRLVSFFCHSIFKKGKKPAELEVLLVVYRKKRTEYHLHCMKILNILHMLGKHKRKNASFSIQNIPNHSIYLFTLVKKK